MSIRSNVEQLLTYSHQLGHHAASKLLEAVQDSLDRNSFHVAILGEFKRGKTSFVNSLLGFPLLHTDVLPATAVIHVLEYGQDEFVEVFYKNGTKQKHALSQALFTEFAVGGSIQSDAIKFIKIALDHPLLKDGLVLIDTPGVNDMVQSRAEVTAEILPYCDAVVFLLDAASPVTRSEADFLKTKVFSNKLDDILYILSKRDRLEEDELEEALEGAEKRAQEVTGKKVNVYPYSSRLVMEARSQGEKHPDLDQLIVHLNDLKLNARENSNIRLKSRLNLVTEMLLEHIQVQEAIHQSNAEQLLVFQQRLDAMAKDIRLRFERLLLSIETVGRQTLIDLVEGSYHKLQDTMLQDLSYDLRAKEGNISKVLERDIPLSMEQSLRRFSEAKAIEIEAYLQRFQGHVAAEYVKHFSIPLHTAMEQSGVKLPSWQAEVDRNDLTKNAIQQAMPFTIGAVIGTVILPGIGSLIGGAIGGVIGTLSRSHQNEQLREQVLSRLVDIISETVAAHRSETRRSIDEWFTGYIEALQQFHEEQYDRLRDQLERKTKPAHLQDVTASQAELMKIRNELERG